MTIWIPILIARFLAWLTAGLLWGFGGLRFRPTVQASQLRSPESRSAHPQVVDVSWTSQPSALPPGGCDNAHHRRGSSIRGLLSPSGTCPYQGAGEASLN